MKYNAPVYSITIDDNDEKLGLTKMSIVEYPAVNVNFLTFNDETTKLIFTANDEKKIITSVALLADTPIKRIDETGELYYVVFTKEVIYKLVKKFFSDDLTKSVNINHLTDTNNAYLIESYLVNSELGLKPIGIHTTEGSWVTTYQITDDNIWADIKLRKLKGFSVEINTILDKFNKINNNKLAIISEAIQKNDIKKLIKIINYNA